MDQTPLVESTDDVILEEEEEEEEEKTKISNKYSADSSSGAGKFTAPTKEKAHRAESGKFRSDISESSLNSIPELIIMERLLQVNSRNFSPFPTPLS